MRGGCVMCLGLCGLISQRLPGALKVVAMSLFCLVCRTNFPRKSFKPQCFFLTRGATNIKIETLDFSWFQRPYLSLLPLHFTNSFFLSRSSHCNSVLSFHPFSVTTSYAPTIFNSTLLSNRVC